MAYDRNKYVKTKLFVKMPNGIMRWVHVRHDMKAMWNMHTVKYPKGKLCAGYVERDGDEWSFNFRDADLYLEFMSEYTKKRETYAIRTPTAIAERAIEISKKYTEMQKAKRLLRRNEKGKTQ